MINSITLELHAATAVTFRRHADSDYATLLGIQNVRQRPNKETKLPISVLLPAHCVAYARTTGLDKGRRFIVQGTLTHSEEHDSFTLRAEQLSVFPLSRSSEAPDEGASTAPSGPEPGKPQPQPTKTKSK